MSSLYNIIAVLCAITLVVLELKRTTFIRILKKEELNTWEKLGRPSGYFLSYLVKIDDFKLEKFIFRKQYNSLKNKETRKREATPLPAINLPHLNYCTHRFDDFTVHNKKLRKL